MGGYQVRGKNMSNNKYLEQVSPEVEEFREKFRETKIPKWYVPELHLGTNILVIISVFYYSLSNLENVIGFRTSRDSDNAYWGQFFCLGISQVSASSAI